MDRLAKQIVQIANEIAEIEKNEEMEKTASINREAGFFTNLFNKGVTEQSSDQIISCLNDMENDIKPCFASLLTGKMDEIKKKIQPLKKGKETNEFYDSIAKWCQSAYKGLPKGLQTFFKTKNVREIIDLQEDWKQAKDENGDAKAQKQKFATQLGKLRDQFVAKIQQIKKDVKKAGVGVNVQNEDDLALLNENWGSISIPSI